MQPKFSHRRYVRRPTSNISSNDTYFLKETQWLLEEKHHGRFTPSSQRDITRLQRGEHVDYAIGFVDFLGCKIGLSKRPFIPRPETEYWVGQAIQEVQKSDNCKKNVPVACLDIFSGSGCVGIAVLKRVPNTVVDFVEKDKRFCNQIVINVKINGINPKRYRVVRSDIFSGVKNKKYDYIFANPPYLAESRKHKVQKSVLKNESIEALFAGKDGLDIIRVFLRQAKDFLVEGGVVYLEFDSFQKRTIERYLKKLGYQNWEFFKDQYANWRFAVIAT